MKTTILQTTTTFLQVSYPTLFRSAFFTPPYKHPFGLYERSYHPPPTRPASIPHGPPVPGPPPPGPTRPHPARPPPRPPRPATAHSTRPATPAPHWTRVPTGPEIDSRSGKREFLHITYHGPQREIGEIKLLGGRSPSEIIISRRVDRWSKIGGHLLRIRTFRNLHPSGPPPLAAGVSHRRSPTRGVGGTS